MPSSDGRSAAPPVPAVTIAHGLRTAASRTPHKPALVDVVSGSMRTFGALRSGINRTYHAARGLGLERGARVALVAANRLEYVETVAGFADAGVAVVTIDPQLHEREIARILDHSGARLVLADPPSREKIGAASTERPARVLGRDWDDLLAQAGDHDSPPLADEWDAFAIPYTSGTTGDPKGVVLSHRSRVMMMLFAMAGGYGVHNPACRALASSPFSSGGGFAHVLAPMFFGGTSFFMPKFSAEGFLATVPRHRINYASVVPTHIGAVLDLDGQLSGGSDLGSLAVVVSNAAPLSQAMKERLLERIGPGKLFDSYGATELGMVAHLRPEEILTRERCVGLAVPGAELRIVDGAGLDVAPGIVGRVMARSPWLFTGYLDDERATAETMLDGWCGVGDMGRRDEEGYLYLVDRMKNLINTGGQNVYAAEVEQVLYAHPSVLEAAVIGVPDAHWGEAVTAVVRLRAGAGATVEDLIGHCRHHLAGYKCPKTLELWPSLPHNSAGKILHRVVRSSLLERRGLHLS